MKESHVSRIRLISKVLGITTALTIELMVAPPASARRRVV
jgi:hypothetical protein